VEEKNVAERGNTKGRRNSAAVTTTKAASGRAASPKQAAKPAVKKAAAPTAVAKKKAAAPVSAAKQATPVKKAAVKKAAPVAKKAVAKKAAPVAKKAVAKKAASTKQTAAPAVDAAAALLAQHDDPTTEVPREERGTAEWSDMNKRMFIQRMEIRAEIDRLEAIGGTANRRALSRLHREYEALTMRIIESNYGLLRKYVKLFTGSASREDARDFEAAGRLGLMRAIDNYDPYRGSFAQWAFKPIQREVLRAVHSADHNNMNPGDFERRPEILRALKKLQGENEDVRPTEAQVAAEAGVTIEQVKRVLHAPRMDSLYMPVGGDGDAVLSDLIEDRSGPIDEAVINAIGVETLANYGLSALDPREYFVLSRRLGLDCEPEQRLSAIGEMLHLSREAVRQIESKAIAKMSHPVLLRLLVKNGKR
jgi:RNA polymerase sigma factor (sigma-70 family)